MQTYFQLIKSKFLGLIYRCLALIQLLPVRLDRLLGHLFKGVNILWKEPTLLLTPSRVLKWYGELFLFGIDVIGIPEIYESFMDFIKFNTRPLTESELKTAKLYFGDSLSYHLIRIDEYAFLGPKFGKYAYVSFNTINSWGNLSSPTLIHELAHIWQYKQIGSNYIPLALWAQLSEDGYNYGGVANLLLAIRSGKGLEYFNLEQQGDIIADHYCITRGLKPRWTDASTSDLWIYEHLLKDFNKKSA